MAFEFPSTTVPVDDKVPQSAELGIDAVMSMIQPGIVLIPGDLINTSTNNPGSLLYSDRLDNGNIFLTFLSMALMGSLENRYGVPSANYHKSVALPWTSATAVTSDGCAFASGVLNFADSLSFLEAFSSSSSAITSKLSDLQIFLSEGLDAACQLGCTTCGGAVSCSSCPLSLRNRNSCTGVSTDVNSCAAAGLVTFVNSTWAGPP